MLKKDLRQKYKIARANLSEKTVEDNSITIANQMLKLPIWDATYFHLFLSIEEQKEINTEFILNILFAKNKEIIISKSNFTTFEMTHFLLTENTRIKKNAYNIPEPVDGIEVPDSKIEVVFIPLLAFDQKGNRVGYGKGFYDRFLHKINCIKIGLSFFEAEEAISDVFENDVVLDYCVTPINIYDFQKK